MEDPGNYSVLHIIEVCRQQTKLILNRLVARGHEGQVRFSLQEDYMRGN